MKLDDMKVDQLRFGQDMRVELQIPPSANLDFRDTETILRQEEISLSMGRIVLV